MAGSSMTSDITHHADWPDGHDAVTPVAVGPGVPARVFPFLQYEHLAGQVLLLITHPSGENTDIGYRKYSTDRANQRSSGE